MFSVVCEVAVPANAVQHLEALGAQVTCLPQHDGPWDMPAGLRPEVLLCKRPPDHLPSQTALKLLQLTTAGYEHLRDRGFADLPIRVCNARGIFDSAIAEWNVAMMINLTRDLRTMLRHQEHAVWDRCDRFQEEIRGRVVGLWGYGGIGRETARLAKAFGLTVHAMTRDGAKPRNNVFAAHGCGDPEGRLPDRVFHLHEKQEFLSGLDFLVLALPHTKTSDGMIGEPELRSLPRHAFLLNPARGPIVQEPALLEALRKRWISGAALDTHFAYPLPPDHPLWRFPNVILTPHISGADRSRLFAARIGELFERNVERWRNGEPLLNELTRGEWLEA